MNYLPLTICAALALQLSFWWYARVFWAYRFGLDGRKPHSEVSRVPNVLKSFERKFEAKCHCFVVGISTLIALLSLLGMVFKH